MVCAARRLAKSHPYATNTNPTATWQDDGYFDPSPANSYSLLDESSRDARPSLRAVVHMVRAARRLRKSHYATNTNRTATWQDDSYFDSHPNSYSLLDESTRDARPSLRAVVHMVRAARRLRKSHHYATNTKPTATRQDDGYFESSLNSSSLSTRTPRPTHQLPHYYLPPSPDFYYDPKPSPLTTSDDGDSSPIGRCLYSCMMVRT